MSPSLAALAEPSDIVGRVTQRTLSLTLRADLTFTPRLVLQVYAQPFGTVGRYDRYQRLASPPRDPDASRRFTPIAALPADGSVTPRLTGPAVALPTDATGSPALVAAGSPSPRAAPADPSSSPSLNLDLDGDG